MQKRKCQSPRLFSPIGPPHVTTAPPTPLGIHSKSQKRDVSHYLPVCVFPPFHGWLSVHPYTRTHTLKWTDVSIWQRRPPPAASTRHFQKIRIVCHRSDGFAPIAQKLLASLAQLKDIEKSISARVYILMGPFFLIFLSPLEQRWMHPVVHYICSVSVSTHPAFAAAPSWALLPSPLLLLE